MPLLMLSAAIAIFYQVSQSSLESREKEIRSAERVMGSKQLEARLKGAFDDPDFLRDFFYGPNVKQLESRKDLAPRLSFVFEDHLAKPEDLRIYYPSPKPSKDPKELRVWIGEGARLSYPNFELCDEKRECPFGAKVVSLSYESKPEGEYLKLTLGIFSTRPDITGPLNASSEQNQIELTVKAGLLGLRVHESSLYCDKEYALHYMHGDPLEVLCRPLN